MRLLFVHRFVQQHPSFRVGGTVPKNPAGEWLSPCDVGKNRENSFRQHYQNKANSLSHNQMQFGNL